MNSHIKWIPDPFTYHHIAYTRKFKKYFCHISTDRVTQDSWEIRVTSREHPINSIFGTNSCSLQEAKKKAALGFFIVTVNDLLGLGNRGLIIL
jgi:hypothetical protein